MSFDFLLKDYPDLKTSVGSITTIKIGKKIEPPKLPDRPHLLSLPADTIAPPKLDDNTKREINDCLKNILPRELRTIALNYLIKGTITLTKRNLLNMAIVHPCKRILGLLDVAECYTLELHALSSKTLGKMSLLIHNGLMVKLFGNVHTRKKLRSIIDYVSKLTSCDVLEPKDDGRGLTLRNDNVCIRASHIQNRFSECWQNLLAKYRVSNFTKDKIMETIAKTTSRGRGKYVECEMVIDKITPFVDQTDTIGQMVWGDHWFGEWNEEELHQRFGYPIDQIDVIRVLCQTAKAKPLCVSDGFSFLHFPLEEEWLTTNHIASSIKWDCTEDGEWNLTIDDRCCVYLFGESITPQIYRSLAKISKKCKTGLREYVVFRWFLRDDVIDSVWILSIPANHIQSHFNVEDAKGTLWLQVTIASSGDFVKIISAKSSNMLWQMFDIMRGTPLLCAIDGHLMDKYPVEWRLDKFNLIERFYDY